MSIEFLQILALELHASFKVQYYNGDYEVTFQIDPYREFGQESIKCAGRAKHFNQAVYYCLYEVERFGVIIPGAAWPLLKLFKKRV